MFSWWRLVSHKSPYMPQCMPEMPIFLCVFTDEPSVSKSFHCYHLSGHRHLVSGNPSRRSRTYESAFPLPELVHRARITVNERAAQQGPTSTCLRVSEGNSSRREDKLRQRRISRNESTHKGALRLPGSVGRGPAPMSLCHCWPTDGCTRSP